MQTTATYFARFGATPYDRARATYEPAAPLAQIAAKCIEHNTCADLLDVVGVPAGAVHHDGRHAPARSSYARA